MKKILLAILIMIATVISCGGKKEAASEGEKELKVGLNSTFAPFEYIKDGKLTGFDVDLINEIGKNLGYKITFIDQAFDGLIPALKAGKIDVIVSGMSATEERKKSVDFTDEYFTSTQVYLRKKGNTSVTEKNTKCKREKKMNYKKRLKNLKKRFIILKKCKKVLQALNLHQMKKKNYIT